jgi:hypothetical protein
MALLEWADKKVKSRTVWDIGVLKIFCVIVGMILGAYWAGFVLHHKVWFFIAEFCFLLCL